MKQDNFQDERKTDKLVLSIAIQNNLVNLADFLLNIITFVSAQTQNCTKLN